MKVLCIPSTKQGYVKRLNDGLRAKGVEVDECPYPYLRWPRNYLIYLRKMREDHDVCHVHWNIFDNRFIAKRFFSTKVPKLWTVHNITPHEPVFKNDLAMTHIYLDRCDVAVWHSERSIKDAKKAFRTTGLPTNWRAMNVTIPVMSFNGMFPDTVDTTFARGKTGYDAKDFVVGHFSPSHPYKGTQNFLDTIALDKDKSIKFVIFGDCNHPTLKKKIEGAAAASKNVRAHLAAISDDELQYWFRSCNVVVQPYSRITTSGAIYFPIAFKTPVIASPLGNIPDVILPGRTGWLAQRPVDIWRCILEAMSDLNALNKIGVRAYEHVEKTAALDKVASAYMESYSKAIAHRGKREK